MIRGLWLVACFCPFLFSATPTKGTGTFSEDFTTTIHKDMVNTTADWSTTAGELRLFALPRLAGSYNTPGTASRVVVLGDHAFVADGASGLQVIDITDPTNPALTGVLSSIWASDVTVAGDVAFVAGGVDGLRVIDITEPTNPTLAGSYNTTGTAQAVAVAGDLAFVADGADGLSIIDITNPTSPTISAISLAPIAAVDVAVSGNFVFVADSSYGLRVIDITDPAIPFYAGAYDTPGEPYGVVVDGDLAFLADGTSGLQVIDISNPIAPALAGTYDTPLVARGVAVDGDIAYIADESSYQMLEISDPTNPILAGVHNASATAYGMAVTGNLIYGASGTSGLEVIRFGEPVPPALVGGYNTAGNAYGVTVAGNLAYLADDGPGVQIIDITDPTNPVLAGSFNTPGNAYKVALAGDFAFVADYAAGLQVVDISNPTTPTLAGGYDTPDYALGVAVAGDLAFLASGYAGFFIFNISDPTNPTLASNYATFFAYDVAVAGDLAFVADYTAGLKVIDISDPTNPALRGSYDTPGYGFRVSVAGDLALVADGSSGLQLIDVSDPSNPTLAGSYDPPGNPYDATVVGDLAFVASNLYGQPGLVVLDISDPSNPTLTSTHSTPGTQSYGVAVAGDFAFVADYTSGLQVIQVFQHEPVLAYNNIGQSLAVDGGTDTIVRARLTSTETPGVSWKLSADGGTNWKDVPSDNSWNRFTATGDELLWRSTLTWAPGLDPTVMDVAIEWLNDFGPITSITDVPNDQGRQVSLEWTRSGHDFVGDPSQIVEYGVYRKIDPNLAMQAQLSAQRFEHLRPAVQEHAMMMQAAGWHFLMTVPVRVEDSYAVVVPTLGDSTIVAGDYQSTFMVTAFTATPGMFFDSPPDSGYSVDNLAPGAPMNLVIGYNTGGGNTLSWDESADADFQYFTVYRSSDPNFVPSPGTLVHSTATNAWTDPDYDGWPVYYKITATDFAGNEGDPATAESATGVTPVIPDHFALYQNVPNPFNPSTVITYDLPPGGGKVTLRIYDVAGRFVREFVDDTEAPGRKQFVWDGRSDSGRSVSGIYFYRLTASGFEQTKKMLLLK